MNDITLNHHVVKPIQTAKIEFWAATAIFVSSLFSLFIEYSPNEYEFMQAGVVYNYYEHFFWPQLVRYTCIYLAFLLLNFKVVPRLMRKEALWWNVLLLVLTFVAVGLLTGITDTYYKGHQLFMYYSAEAFWEDIFQGSFQNTLWLLLVFSFYTFIKYVAHYLLDNAAAIQSRYRLVTQELITVAIVWLVSVFMMVVFNIGDNETALWAIISLNAIVLYFVSLHYLIPAARKSKRKFLAYQARVLLIQALAYVPVFLLLMVALHSEESALEISFVNSLFQFLVTGPITWLIFKRQLAGKEEMFVLKKELGSSTANLDFLRSQINPHFLFNALNTLYGTALQENSERTAQGIQMLGDMMRFMLHENHQQKILLSREIEYMRNYIDLQLLRTSASPNISIETKIDDVVGDLYIAPMLLIPFIENAFKHGISLKHRSWIRISLHSEQNKIFFDVYNSKQKKSEQDPEKDASGIGLINVRQRLNLLYPERHELIIRDTPEEFFVHLTLQL
ncbi:sensor histidine kinase [Pontibacter virosus]|uniref:Histidine kinase n=1 Tax=Pontibacter virosus TaxID=1765052 RepID=A0A2U1ATJ6_9BACT|nr:histidine kinase [Pontibacter virosus]PVY39745.1 histidine kinase [Pontibacter virosus]